MLRFSLADGKCRPAAGSRRASIRKRRCTFKDGAVLECRRDKAWSHSARTWQWDADRKALVATLERRTDGRAGDLHEAGRASGAVVSSAMFDEAEAGVHQGVEGLARSRHDARHAGADRQRCLAGDAHRQLHDGRRRPAALQRRQRLRPSLRRRVRRRAAVDHAVWPPRRRPGDAQAAARVRSEGHAVSRRRATSCNCSRTSTGSRAMPIRFAPTSRCGGHRSS